MKQDRTPLGSMLYVYDTGKAHVSGVDYETARIHVVARNKQAVVLKVAGRTCWSGNYSPRVYEPPEIMVYRIKSEERMTRGDGDTLYVEPLIAWSAGRKKKDKQA